MTYSETLAFIASRLCSEARRLEPSVRYADDIPAERDRAEYDRLVEAIALVNRLAKMPEPRRLP